LENHVSQLASEIGIRNTAKPVALEAAAQYIESLLRDAALEVSFQQFQTADGARVTRKIGDSVRDTISEVLVSFN
jgi:hypothetical protein